MKDESHLNALRGGLSNERVRLANAKTAGERALRSIWVVQYEKQIADERALLGVAGELPGLSDDELLAELEA